MNFINFVNSRLNRSALRLVEKISERRVVKMTYGYIRVSSDKQTVENQRYEINKFAKSNSIIIDGWIEETISGSKNYDKRKLGTLLDRVRSGDLIICAELSRLGRTLFMIMDILNICMSKNCSVWTIKHGFSRQNSYLNKTPSD